MTTMKYDKPIADFIAGLDATGHVTHKSYNKTSVTFHHNAGRLSLQGILDVWKVRPASAHFQVDRAANIGQYVRLREYAWATGNTEGNMRSVNIELANDTLAPEWGVSEVTWKAGARLAAWIFFNEIGVRPSSANVFQHNHWLPTMCAGPYIAKVWPLLLAEVQVQYDMFARGTATPPPSRDEPTRPPVQAKKSNDQIVDEVIAGKWGNGAQRMKKLSDAGYNAAVIQQLVNQKLLGHKVTPKPTPSGRKTNEQICAEVWAGKWGVGNDRVKKLTAAGYNAGVIQTLVNRGVGKSGSSVSKSVTQIATEVIAGKWGNGAQRFAKLKAAGYDANVVQAEVNRRLR